MGFLFATFRNIHAGLLIFKRRKVKDPSPPLREPHHSQYKACEDAKYNAVLAEDTKPQIKVLELKDQWMDTDTDTDTPPAHWRSFTPGNPTPDGRTDRQCY
jgi:hypothetical protein